MTRHATPFLRAALPALALPLFALVAAALPLAASAREVPPPSATRTTGEHQRLLPLEGGQNFRDIGGYRTDDGRMVKWGLIYRSGAMDRLTPDDFHYLASLGLKTVVDLRGTGERKAAPVAWPDASKPTIFTRDYDLDNASLVGPMSTPGLTPEQARAIMAHLYGEIPVNFADQFRTLFAELLANHAPLAFNCSAGKDRTGVAALLLSVLGVDRETVVQDYLLSNRYFRPQTSSVTNDPRAAAFRRLPPATIKALMGVDRSYIETAFAAIDAYPGGAQGYYRDKLGLDPLKIARLREMFLTKAPAAG